MNKFKIFTRTKKTYYTKGGVSLALMCIFLILYWITSSLTTENQLSFVKMLILGCLLLFFAFYFLLQLTSFWRRKPVLGEINGYLEFFDDKIIVQDKIFLLENIKKIEIRGGDYYNEFEISSHIDPDGSIKNGTSNSIKIILNSKESFEYNFQQDHEHDILNIKKTLIGYSKQGKLHFLNLIDILNITDYDEIQDFKKHYY